MIKDRESPEHIFVSYSRRDEWKCRAIYNELLLTGFRVWLDRDLSPGTPDWKTAIERALKESACVVCLCSPSSAKSKWVAFELETALKLKKRIYPIVVGGKFGINILPAGITDIQAIDVRHDYQSMTKKLFLELINNHEEAQLTNLQKILETDSIRWLRFGSLFWFASEARKLRLLIRPESFNKTRAIDSISQLQHHASRLNVDKYTLRDIDHVAVALESLNGEPSNTERINIESKLRMIQDNIGNQAEKIDKTFSDGPVPGRPIISKLGS